MASPNVDPSKARYFPEMLIEAVNQSSISTSGETIAQYRLEDRHAAIEQAEVVTQTANLDMVISTDGSERARLRSDAQTLLDVRRRMKLNARQQIDFTGIMTAGGPTTNVRCRWNLTFRKPLSVDKLRSGIQLDTEELAIAEELRLVDNLALGSIPYHQSLLDIDANKMFDEVIFVERNQAIIAAGAEATIGGAKINANGQLIVLLGVMLDTAILGAGTADDTFLIVDRDSDPEYMKLDITAMPDNVYLKCYVPAVKDLKVYIRSATGTSADGVGFIYGIRDITLADRIRWGLPFPSPTAKLEAQRLVKDYPKFVRSIAAGVM